MERQVEIRSKWDGMGSWPDGNLDVPDNDN